MIGKFPPKYLRKYIFNRIGVKDNDVILGPSIGEDSAIISMDDKYLVVHVDPITGSIGFLGWLAVHIVSNDIAVAGAHPRWLLPVYMFPTDVDERFIDEITKQVDEAAKEVDAMIVGGHSEFTSGLTRPIISMTGLGMVDKNRLVMTSGAREGDNVIMTKSVGLEGTAILASDFKELLLEKGVSEAFLENSMEKIKRVSVVKESLLLSKEGYVTSMHDPTEGGILGGLTEIAYASNKTLVVYEDKMSIEEDTLLYSKLLGIDPLRLISSGVLLATVPRDKTDDVVEFLRRNKIEVSVIGFVKRYDNSLVELHRSNGKVEYVRELQVLDELMRLWDLFK